MKGIPCLWNVPHYPGTGPCPDASPGQVFLLSKSHFQACNLCVVAKTLWILPRERARGPGFHEQSGLSIACFVIYIIGSVGFITLGAHKPLTVQLLETHGDMADLCWLWLGYLAWGCCDGPAEKVDPGGVGEPRLQQLHTEAPGLSPGVELKGKGVGWGWGWKMG